jgi:hypothetical protein
MFTMALVYAARGGAESAAAELERLFRSASEHPDGRAWQIRWTAQIAKLRRRSGFHAENTRNARKNAPGRPRRLRLSAIA